MEKISRSLGDAKGITLSNLAEQSGVSKSYLSNLERGLKKNPSIQIIENVASVLNTDINELLDRDITNLKMNKEWNEFVEEAIKVGIEKEMLVNYKELIAFIKWRNLKEAQRYPD